MSKAAKEISFEEAMGKLEKTVEQMESRELELEQIIAKYEEGMKLVEFCEKKLTAAERKIELLTKTKSGDVKVSPMEEDFPSDEKAGGEDSLF
ncbi:MAG: exodeoxyribonuclease VII small subunit [Verrucomicrobiota bacterium]